ncbi:MAG: hypothetical protein Q8Q39_04510 [bacterium]|nr:hypothetical protein [bacterium]
MAKRLLRSAIGGFMKKPFLVIGFFCIAIFLHFWWDEFIAFTDERPWLRILLSVEWAILRYQEHASLFGLSKTEFFWFLLLQTFCTWLFWSIIFSFVSPMIANKQSVRKIFIYFTLDNHNKNWLARQLTSLVLLGKDHPRWGKLICAVVYAVPSFFSHGDIAPIGVAIGFRQRIMLLVILGAMEAKVIFWSFLYLF